MPESLRDSFAAVFFGNPAGLAVTRRADSVIVEVNAAYCKITGFAREEIIGKTAVSLGIWLDPLEREYFLQQLTTERRVKDYQMRIRCKSGELRYLDVSAELADFQGVECLLTMVIDITQHAQLRLQLEAALADAHRFREALDNVPAYVYIKDLQRRYTYGNKLTLSLFGRTAETIQGATDADFFPAAAAKRLQEIDRRVFSGESTAEEIQVPDSGSGARVYWEVKSPILHNGTIGGLVCIATDITRHKELERKLEEQAHTDSLTQLPNRSYFFEMARKEFARSKRHNKPLSIAMIDLDRFKSINDTYGHEMGDSVLRAVAAVCRKTLRESDLIGRIGGEEFAVLWPETNAAQVRDAAERLRKAIDESTVPMDRGPPVHFTASLGIATLSEADVNLDVFLNRADKALYEAKRAGRNKVNFA